MRPRPFPLLFSLAGLLAMPLAAQTLTHYTVPLDNVEGAWVSTNPVPIRPMVVDGNDVYAVNTHDSTLEWFDSAGEPKEVWPMPWGPVAVAERQNSTGDELLVVCRSSRCLVRVNKLNGEIIDLLRLPAGPGDLLVVEGAIDDDDRAYVSCSEVDIVVEIALPAALDEAMTLNHSWSHAGNQDFRLKNPLFLTWHDATDQVLVTPLLSGNGSTPHFNAVVNTHNADEWSKSLPDEDLFGLDPVTRDVDSQLGVRLGTILFGHAINPANGDLWVLNTEAVNANPDLQSEPLVGGQFSQNRATILRWNSQTSEFDEKDFVLLGPDPTGGGIPEHVGQPYAIDFQANGRAYICGLLTDNVVVLDEDGTYINDWQLPAKAIPRGIVIDESGFPKKVFVYCWGTNTIELYRATGTHLRTYRLNHDPAPPLVQAGRAIFYDGSRSENGAMSCATCHVDGRIDGIAWNLSNKPADDKGPLVTQTLAGIEKMAPFHWRGERPGLLEFNPAFVGLLGASAKLNETQGSEFDQFEAFVFSIQNPANPNQHDSRMLSDGVPASHGATGPGDPQLGQRSFKLDPARGPQTCMDCHDAPGGTSNDNLNIFSNKLKPQTAYLKPPPFHEIWKKDQPEVTINSAAGFPKKVAFLGQGFAHDGEFPNLFSFVGQFSLTASLKEDVTSFVNQWDQGLAPAAHFAYLLDKETRGSVDATTNVNYLIAQATEIVPGVNGVPGSQGAPRHNCTIAVFGMSVLVPGNGVVPMRWFYDADPVNPLFQAEDSTVPPRTASQFLQSTEEDEWNVFVGLPAGMAERFAVDYDFDGIRNKDEVAGNEYVPNGGVGPNPTSIVKGPTTRFTTTKVTRLAFETDEPVKVQVDYWESNDPNGSQTKQTKVRDSYSKVHGIVLNQMRPSTPDNEVPNEALGIMTGGFALAKEVHYDYKITMTDHAQNVTVYNSPFQAFRTKDFVPNGAAAQSTVDRQSIVVSLTFDALVPEGDGHRVHLVAKAAHKKVSNPLLDWRAMGFAVLVKPNGAEEFVDASSPLWQVNEAVPPVPNKYHLEHSEDLNAVAPLLLNARDDDLREGEVALPDQLVLEEGCNVLPPAEPKTKVMIARGPHVIARRTGENNPGETVADFLITGLEPGDEVMIHARCIVDLQECGSIQTDFDGQFGQAGPYRIYIPASGDPESFLQFSFPDTGEKRATVMQPVQ